MFRSPAKTEIGPTTFTVPVKFRPAVLPPLPMTKPDRPWMGVVNVVDGALKLSATGSKTKRPAPLMPLVPSCSRLFRITS